jgi:hypothetical protein
MCSRLCAGKKTAMAGAEAGKTSHTPKAKLVDSD